MAERRKDHGIYRWIIVPLVRACTRGTKVFGAENLPEGPCVIVGNHAQMYGPITAELYMPRARRTWCAGEMMQMKTVPAYAYRDFWSGKPKLTRWFWKLASYVIAPVAVCVFNNAECIGVYHDTRVMQTFRDTVDTLAEGKDVVIFPEELVPYNGILWEFHNGFVNVARLWKQKSGQDLPFVPMYVCPAEKAAYLGEPLVASGRMRTEEDRVAFCRQLQDAITRMAEARPEHRVVPYANVPKKDYPVNKARSVAEP